MTVEHELFGFRLTDVVLIAAVLGIGDMGFVECTAYHVTQTFPHGSPDSYLLGRIGGTGHQCSLCRRFSVEDKHSGTCSACKE